HHPLARPVRCRARPSDRCLARAHDCHHAHPAWAEGRVTRTNGPLPPSPPNETHGTRTDQPTASRSTVPTTITGPRFFRLREGRSLERHLVGRIWSNRRTPTTRRHHGR